MPKKLIKMSKHDAMVTMYRFMLDVIGDPNANDVDLCFNGSKTNAYKLVSAMKVVLDDAYKTKPVPEETQEDRE